MSAQNIVGSKTMTEKINLSWETIGTPLAISVQVALDSEFTQETRTFVIDKSAKSCILDVGPGKWFYRIGSWFGTNDDGVIEWSGIYGPIYIESQKSRVPLLKFPTFLTSIKPEYNGLAFNTGLYEPYYMIIHYTEKDHFKSSGLTSLYKRDWGNGTIHVTNLNPAATYSFQLQMIGGDIATIPKTNTIRLLTEAYIVKNKRAAVPVKPGSTTQNTIFSADKAILQEVIEKNKINFSSHADYLQYKAAKARTSMQQ